MTWNGKEWDCLLEKAALECGIPLTALQLNQCNAHAELLYRWNQKTNLTTITDPLDMVVKHFIDSMLSGRMLTDGERVIDIGSGGGFPGVPLKILNPSLHITLIDAVRKKVSFLKEVIRTLHLGEIEALHERAEALARKSDHHQRYDVAISRAFSSLNTIIPMALPLLKKNGRIIAMKGRNVGEEIDDLVSLRIAMPDGRDIRGMDLHVDSFYYDLPFSGDKRVLLRIIFP